MSENPSKKRSGSETDPLASHPHTDPRESGATCESVAAAAKRSDPQREARLDLVSTYENTCTGCTQPETAWGKESGEKSKVSGGSGLEVKIETHITEDSQEKCIDHNSELQKTRRTVPGTSIMEQFKPLDPKYEEIRYKKGGSLLETMIYKVELNNNEKFVLKSFKMKASDELKRNSILREFYIGRTLGQICENVAKTIEMSQTETADGYVIVEILIEYGGESLHNIKEDAVKPYQIAKQLLETLNLMEDIGVSHLDIKPMNIVWNEKIEMLKMIDFGASVSFYSSPDAIENEIRDYVDRLTGYTALFAPPELLQNKTPRELIPQKADAFYFGMTMISMLLKKNHMSPEAILRRGKTEEDLLMFHTRISEILEKRECGDWIKLILPCLKYHAKDRPTSKSVKRVFDELVSLGKLGSSIVDKSSPAKCIFSGQYKQLGDNYFAMKEYRAAVWYYEKALESENGKTAVVWHYGKALESERESGKISAEICNSLGVAYTELAEYDNARKFLNHSTEIYSELGETSGLSTLYCNLAALDLSLGNKELAMEHYDLAINDLHVPDMAALSSNIGSTFERFGYHETALQYYLRSSDCYEKLGDLPRLAMVYTNAGAAYLGWKKDDEAISMHKRAAETLKAAYKGKPCADLAKVYNNHAVAASAKKDYTGAVELYSRAMNIVRMFYGEDHIDVARIYRNLGACYSLSGDSKMAAECYWYALNIMKRVYGGETHIEVIVCYANLGEVCYKKSDFSNATTFYVKAVSLSKQICGLSRHSAISKAYYGLGLLSEDRQLYGEAAGYYENSIRTYEGPAGPEFARMHCSLAWALKNAGDNHRSKFNYEIALDMYRKHGSSPSELASLYNNLSSVCFSLGLPDEAIKYCESVQKLRPSDSLDYAYSCQNAGAIHTNRGQYEQGIACYQIALPIAERLMPNSPELAELYREASEACLLAGREPEAKEYLVKAAAYPNL